MKMLTWSATIRHDLRLLARPEHDKSTAIRGNDLSAISAAAVGRLIWTRLTDVDNLNRRCCSVSDAGGRADPAGPSDYGSRLFELIGELNNETNRNRAKLFVLQALQAEPRVKEIRSVQVTQNQADRTIMDIKISVLPMDSDTPLNLVFPFFLEGGAVT